MLIRISVLLGYNIPSGKSTMIMGLFSIAMLNYQKVITNVDQLPVLELSTLFFGSILLLLPCSYPPFLASETSIVDWVNISL